MKALIKSFSFAFKGIAYCIKNERNMRIHLTTAIYVFLLSGFFELSRTEYMLLIIVSACVIAMEIINTSIETIVNLLTQHYDHLAKIAKDAAAGAVLVSALAAVIVGVIIFWDIPSFIRMYEFFAGHWWAAVLLAVSVVLAVLFIFFGPNSMMLAAKNRIRKK